MLADELLDHAARLLDGAPTSADLRRAISASYYSLFHRLTTDAATRLAGEYNPTLAAMLRRAAEHRDMRRVCEGLLARGPARPRMIADLFPPPVPQELASIAFAFVELQNARLSADYVTDVEPSLGHAQQSLALARTAAAAWTAIRRQPASSTFLAALLLHDRLTRRG